MRVRPGAGVGTIRLKQHSDGKHIDRAPCGFDGTRPKRQVTVFFQSHHSLAGKLYGLPVREWCDFSGI